MWEGCFRFPTSTCLSAVCLCVSEAEQRLTALSLRFKGRLSALSAHHVLPGNAPIHSAYLSSICLRYNHTRIIGFPLSFADWHFYFRMLCRFFVILAAPETQSSHESGNIESSITVVEITTTVVGEILKGLNGNNVWCVCILTYNGTSLAAMP